MEQPAKPSLLRRFLNNLGFSATPDSTEELEIEIQELIEEGEEQGLISSREGEMLSSIFEFRDTSIKEIMTPSTEIIHAPLDANPKDIIKLIKQHGFSRIPIYNESPDQIKGFIHAKNLLNCAEDTDNQPSSSVASQLSPIFFVRGNDKIMTLLQNFQANGTHMAIVTDEFGATRGLVTLEDILEELVGEIIDETDKPDNPWQVIDEHTLITDAKVDIEEVGHFFDLKFPEGTYESIGGFILEYLGKIPNKGETLSYKDLNITILTADKRHIITVKIHRPVLT